MKRLALNLLLLLLAGATAVMAQPRATKAQLILVPDHTNAIYSTGQQAKVKVTALHCGMALNNATINYEVSEDLMPAHIKKSITLNGNEATINLGTMKKPGFLRVKASITHEGKNYSSLATVGFDTDKLQPSTPMPKDFEEFWKKNVEAVGKLELKPTITLLPERCTDKVNTYHISYQNIGRTKMYGILTVPKAEGKYPAVLRFPGAGVGEKGGDIYHAEKGLIILELGIHGIPVNLTGSVYSDLAGGVLSSYPTYNLDNRDNYFYKRVILGCVKGIDFLLSLPECNGKIGTLGGSQGGALSIMTAALDSRINASVAYFPALSDHFGYINDRAGGWPHMFKGKGNRTEAKMNTAKYYDTANFARLLKNPICYLYGYNDLTCAPTTTCSVYNVITAPKELIIGENIGHWTYPEQMSAMWDWLTTTLQK